MQNFTYQPSHPQYRPDIDGLRAIAVASVVIYHAIPTLIKGGFIGVDIFFVISGFLISSIIFKSLDNGSFTFLDFYTRRIKRIFPAFILVLLASFIFGWLVLLPDEFQQLGQHIAAGAGFVSNWVLWSESGYFDNVAETKPLLHLWSLGIEEQFYLVWPLLLWLAWKKKLNLLSLSCTIALLSLAWNLYHIQYDEVATFYSPLTRFWELMSGSILAWLLLYGKQGWVFYPFIKPFQSSSFPSPHTSHSHFEISQKVGHWMSLLGTLILIYGFWRIHKEMSFPGKWALIPVLGAVLLIAAGPKAWVNQHVLSNRFMVGLGLISFPLYLWHWPLLSFARIIENVVPSIGIRMLAVIAALILAACTYFLIEKPLRYSHTKVNLKVGLLTFSLLLTGVFGFYVSQKDLKAEQGYEQLLFQRKGFEHVLGTSFNWYHGKNDWLFLGNAFHESVAKIKLAEIPSPDLILHEHQRLVKITDTASKYKAQTVLVIGPDKSTIYPEYLPDALQPSPTRYLNFFLNKFKENPHLIVYDPTPYLLANKASTGLLYKRTDSHWNNKGAYFSYLGLAQLLQIQATNVSFQEGKSTGGDLIDISKLTNFPLHQGDAWDVIWKEKPTWTEQQITAEKNSPFGPSTLIINYQALDNRTVWVIGDSFTIGLKPYFNATFHQVRYVGHWFNNIDFLAEEIENAKEKPDLIIIVRVERTF